MCPNNLQVYKEAWLCVFGALLPEEMLSRLSCQSMKSTWQHCYTGIVVKALDFEMSAQPRWLLALVLWGITINPCHVSRGVPRHHIVCLFIMRTTLYSDVLNGDLEKRICFCIWPAKSKWNKDLNKKEK